MAQPVDRLLFVGFNSRVSALDSATGNIAWTWKSTKSSGGYVTLLLLDAQHLIAAVDGYIFCLNPNTGDVIWSNDTKGFGTGVTSLAALQGRQIQDSVIAGAAKKNAEAASTATAAT